MKKKSLFALVAMVLAVAGVAWAAAVCTGPAELSAAGNPTTWSIYQVDPATEYAYSGVNINKGINSDDSVLTDANGLIRGLVISGDFGAAYQSAVANRANGLVVSQSVAGIVGNAAASVDSFVFNTISTTTIRPVFHFIVSNDGAAIANTSSVDVRILDANGNNVLEQVVRVPATNTLGYSMDIPVTLNVPTVDAVPNIYTLDLRWTDSTNTLVQRTYPIYVDRVNAQDSDMTVSFFNGANGEPVGDINVALGQTTQLDRFLTPQTAPTTKYLGVIPDLDNAGAAANLFFTVRNEGRHTMVKNGVYTTRYYWNNAGNLVAKTLFPAATNLFAGYTGQERVAVAAGTWAPRLAAGWETTTYNWTSANLALAMDFDQRTDVANVRVRNAVLANNSAAFVRATYFPSMDVNVNMAQAQGVTGHVSQPTVSAKNVCPVAFEIPVPNPARDDEVYVYPMQISLRVRAADVDRVWGTSSNKWRTIQDKFAKLNQTNGLKNFLDVIGPQKVVGGQTYALANVAPAADLSKYFQVRQVGNDYVISFLMVIADMAKPTGLNDVVAVNNMFIVYDGQKNNVLVDPIYAGEPTTTTPTPTSGPTPTAGPTATPTPGSSSSSGGCSAFGFAPMALLLLAPLALLRKRG